MLTYGNILVNYGNLGDILMIPKHLHQIEAGDIIMHNGYPLYVHELLFTAIGTERIASSRKPRDKDISGFQCLPIVSSDELSDNTKINLKDFDNLIIANLFPNNKNFCVLTNQTNLQELYDKPSDQISYFECHGHLSDATIKQIDESFTATNEHVYKITRPKLRKPKALPATAPDINLDNAEKFGYISKELKAALKTVGITSLGEAFYRAKDAKNPLEVSVERKLNDDLSSLTLGQLKKHPAYIFAKNVQVDDAIAAQFLDPQSFKTLTAQKLVAIEYNSHPEDIRFSLSQAFEMVKNREEFETFVRPTNLRLFITNSQIEKLIENLHTEFEKVSDVVASKPDFSTPYHKFVNDVIQGDNKALQAVSFSRKL